ncbi:MAG: PASTA domain-containing protein, partial [Eubacteriales bacterium]|nr:PASTA domain-containing protein [Eubacteriales bacterium]
NLINESGIDLDQTPMPAAGKNEKGKNEGEMGAKKKKRFKWNKIKVAAIIAALIIAFPLSQLILWAFDNITAPKEVQVPSIVGMTIDEATATLEELGLELEVDKNVSSSEYSEGEIVSQDPEEDMTVKAGKTITVNVSKGIPEGTIPNLIGKTKEDALFLLDSYGYEEGLISEEFSDMPEGVIIEQSPKGGTEASVGTDVSLVISLGEEVVPTTVPDLKGLTVAEAKKVLEREKLVLGTTDYAPSSKYEQNLIIDQSISAGSSTDSGTTINITLSTGEDEIGGAEDVKIKISYAAAKNDVFYLTVMVTDSTGVSTPINYEQRIKSNGQESFTATGSGSGSIKVYFDNTLVDEYAVDFDSGTVD